MRAGEKPPPPDAAELAALPKRGQFAIDARAIRHAIASVSPEATALLLPNLELHLERGEDPPPRRAEEQPDRLVVQLRGGGEGGGGAAAGRGGHREGCKAIGARAAADDCLIY